MRRIAIIGVGLLGSAVASRLLEGGFEVVGYDRRPEQLTTLATRGLASTMSVKDAASGADAVFTKPVEWTRMLEYLRRPDLAASA